MSIFNKEGKAVALIAADEEGGVIGISNEEGRKITLDIRENGGTLQILNKEEKLIVVKANRSEVPALLCLSTVSIFFIMPVYSKTASSPTKLGEVLSMGIPVITNSGVGDVDEILGGTQCGTVIQQLDVFNYQKAVLGIDALLQTPKIEMRKLATKYFSLKDGINAFDRVYSKIENLQQ